MGFGKTKWTRLVTPTVLALLLGAVSTVMNTMQAMTTPSGSQPAARTMTSVTVSGVNYYQCGSL